MIAGELKTRIDAVWNDFWSGGISNPLEVMDQLTYLLFIKGLDEAQTRAEHKANRTGLAIEDPIFPAGMFTPDGTTVGRPYEDLRWGQFKNLAASGRRCWPRWRRPRRRRGRCRRTSMTGPSWRPASTRSTPCWARPGGSSIRSRTGSSRSAGCRRDRGPAMSTTCCGATTGCRWRWSRPRRRCCRR